MRHLADNPALLPSASVESQTQQARDSDALVEAEQFATLTPDTLVRVPVNKGSSGHSSKEEGR